LTFYDQFVFFVATTIDGCDDYDEGKLFSVDCDRYVDCTVDGVGNRYFDYDSYVSLPSSLPMPIEMLMSMIGMASSLLTSMTTYCCPWVMMV